MNGNAISGSLELALRSGKRDDNYGEPVRVKVSGDEESQNQ